MQTLVYFPFIIQPVGVVRLPQCHVRRTFINYFLCPEPCKRRVVTGVRHTFFFRTLIPRPQDPLLTEWTYPVRRSDLPQCNFVMRGVGLRDNLCHLTQMTPRCQHVKPVQDLISRRPRFCRTFVCAESGGAFVYVVHSYHCARSAHGAGWQTDGCAFISLTHTTAPFT